MKQLFSSTLVAVMVIACCYGSVSALEAPDAGQPYAIQLQCWPDGGGQCRHDQYQL